MKILFIINNWFLILITIPDVLILGNQYLNIKNAQYSWYQEYMC